MRPRAQLRRRGCNPPGTREPSRRHGPDAVPRLDLARRHAADDRSRIRPADEHGGEGYATDGDGDGFADVWNPADAIAGAARLLRANGAPADYRRAIYAYNHADCVRRGRARAGERSTAAPSRRAPRAAPVRYSPGRSRTSAASRYNLGPADRSRRLGADMQSREPAGTTCDCSMFARWAFAQAGIDIGLTTVDPVDRRTAPPARRHAAGDAAVVARRRLRPPPGGYQPADLIFFGVEDGANGHVALWLGNGQIVQCSSSGNGSNIRPLAGYVAPTGWVRWTLTIDG